MTREEVKAQLAKCPLVWEEKNETISTKVLSWVGVPCVDFEIVLGESLHLSTYLSEDDRLPSILIQEEEEEEESVERLKEKAEAHRLDFICRLLGVNEQQIESSINGNKTEDLLLNRIEEIERIVDRAEDQVDDIIEDYGDNPSIGSDKVTVVFSKIREAISQIKSVAVSPRTQGVTLKE